MLVLIDNYDSFTYNLFHYISKIKKNVEVVRNDKIDGSGALTNGMVRGTRPEGEVRAREVRGGEAQRARGDARRPIRSGTGAGQTRRNRSAC